MIKCPAMTFTRNVKDTVLARINAEPELKEVLKEEGINAYLQGDIDTGKAIEKWLVDVAVPAAQAMQDNPAMGLSVDEVKASLAEHANARKQVSGVLKRPAAIPKEKLKASDIAHVGLEKWLVEEGVPVYDEAVNDPPSLVSSQDARAILARHHEQWLKKNS